MRLGTYSLSYSAPMANEKVQADASSLHGGPTPTPRFRQRSRRRPGSAATLLAGALLVASCGGGNDDAATGTSSTDQPGQTTAVERQIELGEQVYAANCATCHGAAGEGGFGPELADGAIIARYPDVDDHRAVVVNGRNAMPAWGDTLTDDEIDAVVHYERERLAGR